MNKERLHTFLNETLLPKKAGHFFLPAFLACYAVFQYLLSADLTLETFSGRMIGIATIEGKDISARVGMFTNGLYILLAVLTGAMLLINWLLNRALLSEKILRPMNHVAFAGLIILSFAVFGIPVKGSLSLIITLLLLLAFASLINVLRRGRQTAFQVAWFTVIMAWAFAFYFPIREVIQSIGQEGAYVPLHPFMLLFGSVALLLLMWAVDRKGLRPEDLARATVPWLFLPLLSVGCDEVYLILNNKGIFSITPQWIYLTGLTGLAVWFAIRVRKVSRSVDKSSMSDLVGKYYFPALLISMGIFTFYEPFLHVRNELFELGNPALGIQRFHLYGEIPILETFNSHLLAELFYGFLYTFVNGFHGVDYHLYYFLNRVIYGLVCYYFFTRSLKSPYVAFFLVMLMAFGTTLVPRSFYTALLAIFVLEHLFKKERKRDHFGFFIILCGLILWRIDIGFANLIAMTTTVILLYVIGSRQPSWRYAWQAAVTVIGSLLLIVLLIAWMKDIPLIGNAQKALHYLSSAQTYGYLDITPDGLAKREWHYFIFPALIALFLLYFLFFEFRNRINREEAFVSIAFVYLTVFYLANLQRGIVRHGLIEGTDEVHTSFGFLILAFIPYLLSSRLIEHGRSKVFMIAATILIGAFHYGGVQHDRNVYHLMGEKISDYRHITPTPQRIERAIMPENFEEEHCAELKQFLDHNFPDSATFIDFSNTPMLYFYLQRPVPSYFNQNLLSIHDDYLQDAYIEHLQQYDIPVVVYSNYPGNWFDAVDGVPNAVRHYRIAEYIHSNYHPFAIMDRHTVWLKNGMENSIGSEMTDISYEWRVEEEKTRLLPEPGRLEEDEKLWMTFETTVYAATPTVEVDGSVLAPTHFVSSVAYYSLKQWPQYINIHVTDTNIERSFNIFKTNYLPDRYSGQPAYMDLGQLPAIWAAYDHTDHERLLLFDLQKPDVNNRYQFLLDPVMDKSSGNYLELVLKKDHQLNGLVRVVYGRDQKVEGTYAFDLVPGKEKYLLRLSMQYRWLAIENDYIRIELPSGNQDRFEELVLRTGILKGD